MLHSPPPYCRPASAGPVAADGWAGWRVAAREGIGEPLERRIFELLRRNRQDHADRAGMDARGQALPDTALRARASCSSRARSSCCPARGSLRLPLPLSGGYRLRRPPEHDWHVVRRPPEPQRGGAGLRLALAQPARLTQGVEQPGLRLLAQLAPVPFGEPIDGQGLRRAFQDHGRRLVVVEGDRHHQPAPQLPAHANRCLQPVLRPGAARFGWRRCGPGPPLPVGQQFAVPSCPAE